MVKIINLGDGKNGRHAKTDDALEEIELLGVKGMNLIYRENSMKDMRGSHEEFKLVRKELEKNVGELIGIKRYAGAYSIYGGFLPDEGPTSIAARKFFKLNESGVVQNWEISDIFIRNNDKFDKNEEYKEVRIWGSQKEGQVPIFHSLLELLEMSEVRGVEYARIWVETEKNSLKDGLSDGFYLNGLNKKAEYGLRLDYFVGIEKFTKSLKQRDQRINFVPQEYPNVLPIRAAFYKGYPQTDRLEEAFRIKDQIDVLYHMPNFQHKEEGNKDSFLHAVKRINEVEKRYNDILKEQEALC